MARLKRRTIKKRKRRAIDASGGNDRASAKKFKRGGRVEAYTWGEALKSKRWP